MELDHLVKAFPQSHSLEVRTAAKGWKTPHYVAVRGRFEVRVAGELVQIPVRIYTDHSAPTTGHSRGSDFANCLLTRHHDGFVREKALNQIIDLNQPWSVPFVIQLTGEYVIEILDTIDRERNRLDPLVVGEFLRENPAFHLKIRQRIFSYWNAYYRRRPRREYVGFKVLALLDKMAANAELLP